MCFYPEHPEHPERFCKSAIRSPCFHRAAVLYVELQFVEMFWLTINKEQLTISENAYAFWLYKKAL